MNDIFERTAGKRFFLNENKIHRSVFPPSFYILYHIAGIQRDSFLSQFRVYKKEEEKKRKRMYITKKKKNSIENLMDKKKVIVK